MASLILAAKASGQTLAIFVFLMLALRMFGRGLVSQLTVVGYLIIALLGSAVEASLYGGGGQFVAGISAATTVFLANKLSTVLANRSAKVHDLLLGTPTILVHDGQIVQEHMHQSGLTRADVMEAIRLQGHDSMDDVRYAVLEANGGISIIPFD